LPKAGGAPNIIERVLDQERRLEKVERVRRTPIYTGTGSPNGVVTASVGSLFLRKDGGAGTTLYVKESGTGNTGWVAK